MITRTELIAKFAHLTTGNRGLESFVCESTDELVIERLRKLEIEPLTKVQLNQLLGLSHEVGVSDGFFSFYWTAAYQSVTPPHEVKGYSEDFIGTEHILSIDHLVWGLTRIYIDGLYFCGNVRRYFRRFGSASLDDLLVITSSHQVDTEAVVRRGPPLPFAKIPKDDRYLISEMACKTYGIDPQKESTLRTALVDAFKAHKASGGNRVTIRALLDGKFVKSNYANETQMFLLSADDMLDEEVGDETELESAYARVAKQFLSAREAAMENTRKYLSLVNDLDVYVATSMRTRAQFRRMAEDCETIFMDARLKDLHLRFFDPTMSAAEGHQDKGLIECLMVKCAKVLVYCAGEKESYGKDAEASMSLSLGKPVLFFCDSEEKKRFFRDVHPLSRLINFQTGVAVGAIVADNIDTICELLSRIFRNEMEYDLDQPKSGYLVLKERLTQSVVRLQTNDRLLTEAFWNYYGSADGKAIAREGHL